MEPEDFRDLLASVIDVPGSLLRWDQHRGPFFKSLLSPTASLEKKPSSRKSQVLVVCAFNPSTREAEEAGSFCEFEAKPGHCSEIRTARVM